jgi:hypothetical protein
VGLWRDAGASVAEDRAHGMGKGMAGHGVTRSRARWQRGCRRRGCALDSVYSAIVSRRSWYVGRSMRVFCYARMG